MLHKIPNSVWQEDLRRFLQNFQTPPKLELEYFHPVQLPVVVYEVQVKLRILQEGSLLSLLILRLYDAGIRTPEAISGISGMSLETVKSFIHKAKFQLGHIDPATNALTALGLQTLTVNVGLEDGPARFCRDYENALRIHMDPLTASLFPAYLEHDVWDAITPNPQAGDFLLPPENAPTDQAFMQELNSRLLSDLNQRMDKHIQCDAINSGNVLENITAFRPIHLFYRWGYLAKFVGMTYPMMVFSGPHHSDITLPIALTRGDKLYLQRNGIYFPRVSQRGDAYFTLLQEMVQGMTLTLPSEEATEEEISRPPVSLAEPDWTKMPEEAPEEMPELEISAEEIPEDTPAEALEEPNLTEEEVVES